MQNISAEDFLILSFNFAVEHVQNLADKIEEKNLKSFKKGSFIMIYFYIFTYMIMFSLKSKYPIEYINYVEDELTNGYLNSVSKNRAKSIKKYFVSIRTFFDAEFNNSIPNIETFTRFIIQESFSERLFDSALFLEIFSSITLDFKFVLNTTNSFNILV